LRNSPANQLCLGIYQKALKGDWIKLIRLDKQTPEKMKNISEKKEIVEEFISGLIKALKAVGKWILLRYSKDTENK